MKNNILSPVQITQKVLGLLSTRKDICEKLLTEKTDTSLSKKLEDTLQQSDQFINQLMSELSNYGDAVLSEIDRDSEYQAQWKKELEKMNNSGFQPSENAFLDLEKSLQNAYKEILENRDNLPESLTNILEKQLREIE
jgi:aspartate/tyrosine/aromatic aminotransferase